MDFKYTPLTRLENRAITRLFLLLPGSGPLSIILFEHILLNNDDIESKYDVLSYCWESEHDETVITFDGASLNIPKTLAQCLQQLRTANHTRLLWAESICVNQGDLEEKAYQVSILGTVYKNAGRVLAWLGEDHGSMTVLAFEHFEKHAKPNANHGASALPISPDAEIGVCDLLLRPWFKRVWATVAFALARELCFLCGSHQVSLNSFLNGTEFLAESTKYDANFVTTHLVRLRLLEGLRHPGADRSLRTLLCRVRQWYAADNRDKVFATLAMTSSPWQDLGFRLSYKANYQTLYTRAALVIIVQEGGSLAILNSPRGQQHNDFPTWVPDWSDIEDHEQELPPQFRTWSEDLDLRPTFDDKRRVMRVQGIFTGRISSVGAILLPSGAKSREFFHYNDACPESPRHWPQKISLVAPTWKQPMKDLRGWYKLVTTCSSPQYISEQTHRENFYTTLQCNQDLSSEFTGRLGWNVSTFRAWRSSLDWLLPVWAPAALPIVAYVEFALRCTFDAYQNIFLLTYCVWFGPDCVTDSLANWVVPVNLLAAVALALVSWERDLSDAAQRLRYAHNRRFALVHDQNKTFMALVPPIAKEGDEVAILAGATNPLVLRRSSQRTTISYELVGQCYVHGLLDGKLDGADSGSSRIIKQYQNSFPKKSRIPDGWKTEMILLT